MTTLLALVEPAAARAQADPVAASYTEMSAGRITAMIAAGMGVIGVVVAVIGLTRTRRRGPSDLGPRTGGTAIAAGLIGVALGVGVVVTADGGLGTGNGLGGGLFAGVLGLLAIGMGAMLLRIHRVG